MDILAGLTGLMIGAAGGWRFARVRAAREMSRLQARLQARIGYWQEEAERARASTARVSEKAAAWAAGCKQGREDVVTIARALAHHATGAGDGPAVDDRTPRYSRL